MVAGKSEISGNHFAAFVVPCAMPRTPRFRRVVTATAAMALLLTACGADGAAPATPEAAAAGDAADANRDDLQQTGNVLDIEVLDVSDGSKSTLRTAVDGDRPVLLWFYAPH